MNVAIIGAGNVGGALARSLAKAGHSVTVSSTKAEEAEKLAQEVGGKAAGSNAVAIEGADVVILAVYYDSIGPILDEVGSALDGKVVVDVGNRMGENPGTVVDGTSDAEQVQAKIPAAKVVKAFNTAFAARQADPSVNGVAVDAFVAGNDEEARQKVLELARSIGMNPIDAGTLEVARILEAMGALIIALNMDGGSWQGAWKILEPTP